MDDVRIEGPIEVLYHGTSSSHLDGILSDGLRPDSCWGTIEMARHFAKVECKGSGGKAVILGRRLSMFDPASLRPDEEAVDFPMSEVFGIGYDHLAMAWEEIPEPDWEDSLRIYRSLVCAPVVVITSGHVLNKGALLPADDADQEVRSSFAP